MYGYGSHAALGLTGRLAASRAAQTLGAGFGGGFAEGAFRATLDGQNVGGIARAAVVDGLIGAATAGLIDRAVVGIGYAGQAVRNATSRSVVAPKGASSTAVHFTSEAGKKGIEASRYLNGPSSVWTFAANRVPTNKFSAGIKSLVRPKRLTHTVEGINAANLIKPKLRGPWSAFQRMTGVRRTPGPGTYQIDTGVFHARKLYDPVTKQLRPMTSRELVFAGRAHDAALETIGWGFVAIPPATAWSYLQIFGADDVGGVND